MKAKQRENSSTCLHNPSTQEAEASGVTVPNGQKAWQEQTQATERKDGRKENRKKKNQSFFVITMTKNSACATASEAWPSDT